jgi:hypothetical protein
LLYETLSLVPPATFVLAARIVFYEVFYY